MDRPDPPSVDDAGPLADGYDDMAAQRRSVAADMDSIFAPLASASAVGVAQPPLATPPAGAGRISARRRIAVIGGVGVAFGLAAAAYVLHPAGDSTARTDHGASVAASPYRSPPLAVTPTPELASAVAPPALPPSEPADRPAPKKARSRSERPVAAMARVSAAPPPTFRHDRAARDCGRACLRASELAAHRALERAYYAAADAGVSQDELSDYRSDWGRLRRRTARDPRTLVREYNALADELYERALEERSAPH